MARQRVDSAVIDFNGRRYADELSSLAIRLGRVATGRTMGTNRSILVKLLVTLVVALLAARFIDGGAAVFLGLLAASLAGLVDGRASIVLGLACVASCPILLVLGTTGVLQQSSFVAYHVASMGVSTLDGTADQTAIWAYYFLCIGVGTLIVRRIVERKADRDEGTTNG